MSILFLSSLMMLAALALLLRGRHGASVRTAALVSLLWVAWSVAAVFHLIADYFTGEGFDEAVLFHLRVGLGGTGWREYWLPASLAVLLAASVVVSAWMLFRRLRLRSNDHGSEPGRRNLWLGAALALFALIVNPAATAAGRMAMLSMGHSGKDAPPVFAMTPERIDGEPLRNRRNLVYIYLESVERTYLNEALFPGLTPHLKRLESLGTTYTDVRQVHGTGWTIAGMVASQCGVPLVLPGDSSVATTLDQFLPEARCMGDVLGDEGYELLFLGGADIGFAGKGNFYKTHGFSRVLGRHELEGRLPAGRAQSAWGLYDDDLLDMVHAEYVQLAAKKRPFGIFALTLDTHHPIGHETPSCRDHRYQDGQNPMLNAIACADHLVGQLIDRMLKDPAAADTVFVVASDHLAMNNAAIDRLREGERRNLFIVIDGAQLGAKEVSQPASTLDVGATVLPWLLDGNGDDAPVRLGYGQSLGYGQVSLVEELLLDTDDFLSRHDRFHASLWDRPTLKDGIQLLPDGQGLALGARSIRLPALMRVDVRGRLLALRSADHEKWSLPRQVLSGPADRHFVWVDDCAQTRALEPGSPAEGHRCLAVGRMGDSRLHVQTLEPGKHIDLASLRAHLSDSPPDLLAFHRRQAYGRQPVVAE